jgi:hypothetical protein
VLLLEKYYLGAFSAAPKTGLCGGSAAAHGLEALRRGRYAPLQSLARTPTGWAGYNGPLTTLITLISGRVMCGLRGLTGYRREIGQMRKFTAKSNKLNK